MTTFAQNDPQARQRARQLAQAYQAQGDFTGWFEALYAEGRAGQALIPWADRAVNPYFADWLTAYPQSWTGVRCAVVGCGLGDDAEALAALGADVVAFDIAPSAVAWSQQRFPASAVHYCTADVLHPPAEWTGLFDFVLEIYTVQVFREFAQRQQVLHQLANLLSPQGKLLLIARGRQAGEPIGQMPWPLAVSELAELVKEQLYLDGTVGSVEELWEAGSPPILRLRALYRKGQRS
ncbi:MAG TPA: class I SAM-dependent methyltransferase [Anaerolineales bacterium]|nr:class I SAM-dependent methyltransferase [Anaerolineales bacterium]